MQIDIVTSRTAATAEADAIVVGLVQDSEGQDETLDALDKAVGGLIMVVRGSGEASGEHGEITVLHTANRSEARRVILVGLGKRRTLDSERLREAAGSAARALRRAGIAHAAWALPSPGMSGIAERSASRAIVEGTLLGSYRFTTYMSRPSVATSLEKLDLIVGSDSAAEAREGSTIGAAMAAGAATARDLVNTPPNVLFPAELARRAMTLADEVGLSCEVLGPEEMTAAGMGALLGVAAGSHQPPRLIVLRYQPTEGAGGQTPIGLIGKGITFDTGGISIKAAQDMHLMKGDMAGAAAVIGALHTVALLKGNRPVVGIIASAENMPGGAAMRPGDVVRAMDGTTIEVQNTDAEGRLVLADAICYARQLGLAPLVDAATLTGAIAVALGPYFAGFFANDEALATALTGAMEKAGERFWRMPLHDDYVPLLDSDCADLRNVGGREGGAIIGAVFIEHFAKETPWAHLDIAAVDYATKESGYSPKGGTGVAARSLAQFALDGGA